MTDKNSWAAVLSTALQEWFSHTTYQSIAQLAHELDISESILRHIFRGSAISDKPEVYAKIFAKTSLSQADPTTIPPRVFTLPGGSTTTVLRSWTKEQYKKWVILHNNSHTIEKIRAHCLELSDLLQIFANSSETERDELIRYAHIELGELYSLLAVLTLQPQDRERSLQLRKEFSNV